MLFKEKKEMLINKSYKYCRIGLKKNGKGIK